jgi:hypothetical protein
MSAMSARVTELSERPAALTSPAPPETAPRADRRTMLKLARRTRQRWALLGGAILAVSFGLTVGILDVLR